MNSLVRLISKLGFVSLVGMLVAAFSTKLIAQEANPQYDVSLYQDMKWRNIGPFRGGRSVAAAGVTSDPLTYYFGGVGGGVWKTEDGGENWTNITDGFVQTSSVGAIAVAESDPNVIYVGMGEHAVRGVATSHGNGVYKSTDAGRTWKHIGLELTRAVSRIRIHPENPDLVYVAAQGAPYGPTEERGIYRSTDGGETWERILYVSDTAGASDLSMDRTNPRILYASFWDHLRHPWQVRSGGPGSGFHKSTDGGSTWEQLTNGFPELMGKTCVDVSANPNRVYAMVEADPGGGLYRSDDGGKSWKLMTGDWTIRARAWYYTNVFADPKNEDVVWVLAAPMTKSIDGGKTFTPVQVPHGDTHDLWINPENTDILINANDGGVNVSFTGGKSWSTQENQPTAQFYRVNTDNRFPYYVYGAQQDNTTVAIASRTFGAGIGWKDWYEVGGCESGYVAFDPEDPRFVYAGCFMGLITEYDQRTKNVRDVQAYPLFPVALPPREMKYRFNWNAPIVVSQHDPRVIYQGGNVLLKTEDRGLSWMEVSPDLTLNDTEKQGPGGAPITSEGAGGETYNTIFYVAESPHDPETIWTGSDDGLVHVTRDGGQNWENVTPEGIGEAQINAIEVSPHDPATAYIAVTRYKFNDFTQLAFKTSDYGKDWKPIVEGIAEDAWVRVVREDPIRKGLLYAGTETGIYVSFDDGERWQSLQLNLPITPVTDLKVQSDDLVAATQGRAFWILDDLSPLRQIDDDVAAAALHVFKPHDAHRIGGFAFFIMPGGSRLGKNPPPGVFIDYHLAEAPESPVTLEILDSAGEMVRSYSSEKKAGGMAAGRSLPVKAGMNRFTWDLRHEPIRPIPGLFVFGSLQGRKVVPGTYQARLTVGDESRTESFSVKGDPRVEATAEDFREQDALVVDIETDLNAIHEAVIELRSVRDQLEEVMKRAEHHAEKDAVAEAGKALVDKLTDMEDILIQKRTIDMQTILNAPSRLNHHYVYLRMSVDAGEGEVKDGARKRLTDLSAQWSQHKAALDGLLGEELAAFNALVRDKGVPAVVVPSKN